MSPRKVRLVVDVIRGKAVPLAVTHLQFLQKEAARPVLKLLQSAMANAEHNFKLDPSTLRVKSVVADGGPTLKRWRPRAFGRAAPIRKRTTHITLVLTDEKAVQVGKKKAKILKATAKRKASRTKPATATTVPHETGSTEKH